MDDLLHSLSHFRKKTLEDRPNFFDHTRWKTLDRVVGEILENREEINLSDAIRRDELTMNLARLRGVLG